MLGSAIEESGAILDGTAWSVTPGLNFGTSDNDLSGGSCISPTSCMALGSACESESQPVATLVEAREGLACSIVPSPNPTPIRSCEGLPRMTTHAASVKWQYRPLIEVGQRSAGATPLFVNDRFTKLMQEGPLLRSKKFRELAVTGLPAGGSIREKGKVRLAVLEQ